MTHVVATPQTPSPLSSPRKSPRWFHLLAGPNGAGKSTLYRALVREGILGPPLEFVNADLHERAHLQHMTDPQQRSEAARAWAEARRTAPAMQIHLTGGRVERVDLVHPPQIRFVCAASRP